ncbi:MAG: HU family DNA-binding protein [Gammaproteobacteria bacterium]|nr:HU family DNA-binding protein [Gammaproteobacteria bacterium]
MGTELTKAGLAERLAGQASITVSEATQQLNAVLQSVECALSEGHKIVLTGFGKFEVKERAARTGRNPSTGLPMDIAASNTINFKAGKALKEAIQAVMLESAT